MNTTKRPPLSIIIPYQLDYKPIPLKQTAGLNETLLKKGSQNTMNMCFHLIQMLLEDLPSNPVMGE
jgi:hypothetical protein